MSAQAQRRRPRAREHAAAQAQRVRRARAAASGMSPSAPRSATKSPRVRTASPQARRVITLESYEESKGEDAEAEVARLEAQLEEARRRAYEKRTGKPAPPRKVQFAESGDWSEPWHELADDRAAQYPAEAPPPPADAPAAAPAPAAELSEDGKAFRAALAEKARKLAEEKAERARIKAEAEAKAAEERRLAREAEDETNGADPERVYCGVRLVGRLSSMMSGDRPLPPQFKCGVCQTANAAEAIRCRSCAAARIAPSLPCC